MYLYITTDHLSGEAVVRDLLSPALNRSPEKLSQRLLFGPPSGCAEKLAAYQAAGAQRIFLWPVVDELRQRNISWNTSCLLFQKLGQRSSNALRPPNGIYPLRLLRTNCANVRNAPIEDYM